MQIHQLIARSHSDGDAENKNRGKLESYYIDADARVSSPSSGKLDMGVGVAQEEFETLGEVVRSIESLYLGIL